MRAASSLMGLFLLKNRYVPFACCASGTFFCSKCPPFPLWILYGYLRDSIGIWMVCRGMTMGDDALLMSDECQLVENQMLDNEDIIDRCNGMADNLIDTQNLLQLICFCSQFLRVLFCQFI